MSDQHPGIVTASKIVEFVSRPESFRLSPPRNSCPREVRKVQPPNLDNPDKTGNSGQPTVVRSSTGPNRRFQPQSLGRVRDPVRIAEGPTAVDAATQRRHFRFRLRLVDNLQPIGGAWQRPRREDGKRRKGNRCQKEIDVSASLLEIGVGASLLWVEIITGRLGIVREPRRRGRSPREKVT